MKYLIIVLTLIPFITLGQCFEIKNDNGDVINSSFGGKYSLNFSGVNIGIG